jgi:L-malate glycosyltransferase
MQYRVCYFVGTNNDWAGASRILFNIVRRIDRSRFAPVVMLTKRGPICSELDSLGIRYETWSRHDTSNLRAFAAGIVQSYRFFATSRIDLIHFNHGCLVWRPAELAVARHRGIPRVVHCQRIVQTPSPDLRQASVAITSSAFLANSSDTGKVEKRTIYDVVDLNRFAGGVSVRSALGLDASHTVFSFIGRARKAKGLEKFIQLASRLRGENLRFLITRQRAGRPTADVYEPHEIATLIASDKRIHYLDFREDIENIYASSDVIVMPSQEDEHCPAVPAEAGAAGKPILATSVGATVEMVNHGSTGFLVDRTDLDAMVTYAERLAIDSNLRRTMGAAAREFVEGKFWRTPIIEIESLYDELISGASRGGA